jgi:hypothetical protein
MLDASVPKIAVNKYSYTMHREDKVRFTKNVCAPSPSINSVLPEQGNEPQLSCLIIRAADPTHQARATFL